MSGVSQRLLDEALTLPEDERLELATELIASVDGEALPPSDWQAVWAEELDRRVDAARARGESGADWTEVRSRILARLAAR